MLSRDIPCTIVELRHKPRHKLFSDRVNKGESQLLLAIDARRKLQATIDALESKRKEAEIDFAKTFVKDTRAKSIDVEAAFKANEAWRTKDERSK